jgi:hypothetical protein
MSEVRRLESILASSFWENAETRCTVEELSLQVSRQQGAYWWRFDDQRDSAYVKDDEPHSSLQVAKDAMKEILESALERHRRKAIVPCPQSTSTLSS